MNQAARRRSGSETEPVRVLGRGLRAARGVCGGRSTLGGSEAGPPLKPGFAPEL
jgi:hypothetical protein